MTAGIGTPMEQDYIYLILTGVFGAGGLVGVLGQILLARYSKSKEQRRVDIAKEYLELSKMTVDELEKKINLISKLDKDVRHLENENNLLQQKLGQMESERKTRGEQMIALEAQLQALQLQVDKDARERADLRLKLSEFDLRYRILWKYLISLLEQLKKHEITPVEPPEELKTDPEILKFFPDKETKT